MNEENGVRNLNLRGSLTRPSLEQPLSDRVVLWDATESVCFSTERIFAMLRRDIIYSDWEKCAPFVSHFYV
jgi:hypothetical protein